MATKTVQEWFDTLKEPYKTQAINNTDKDTLKDTAENLSNALEKSFFWLASSEGHDYWSEVNRNTLFHVEHPEKS